MSSKLIRLLSILLLNFQLLSDEFTFFNNYDAETNEGVVELRLFGKNDKSIGINCSPVDNFDGPVMWFSLGQSVKSSSAGTSMFYKFDDGGKVNFPVWPYQSDDKKFLVLVNFNNDSYGSDEFSWIEDFMQGLASAETLTVGLSKSISETKFSDISGKEYLEKFFEVASTIDSCYLRTAEEETERYAEFRSDLAQIIKDHYLLLFSQPLQEFHYYYGEDRKEDGLCWGTELYEFILNEEGDEYVHASFIDATSFTGTARAPDMTTNFDGLWKLQINAGSSLGKLESLTLEEYEYDLLETDFEKYYCADLEKIRELYGFDDLKTEEYQNVKSIIGEEWSKKNKYDPSKVTSLFNKLSFTLKIDGFKVTEEFEKLSNGFYKKWGDSEFIEKRSGRSITDQTIFFKCACGRKTPIVLEFSLDPYTYDVAGSIRFEDEDFDWSLWLD
mgnify:CR=1 FL=1